MCPVVGMMCYLFQAKLADKEAVSLQLQQVQSQLEQQRAEASEKSHKLHRLETEMSYSRTQLQERMEGATASLVRAHWVKWIVRATGWYDDTG